MQQALQLFKNLTFGLKASDLNITSEEKQQYWVLT